MNTLSARENFHRTHDEKQRSELSQLVNSTPVKEAMIVTMARLMEMGATKDYLQGARLFCIELLNIADPIMKPDEFKPEILDRVPGTPDGR